MISTYDVFISIIPARIDANTHYHQVLLVFNPDNECNQAQVVDLLHISTDTKQLIPFNELVIGSSKTKDTYIAKVHITYNIIEYLKELYAKLDNIKLTYNKQNLDKIK